MGLVVLLLLMLYHLCLTLKIVIAERIQREKLKFIYKLIHSAILIYPYIITMLKSGDIKMIKTLFMPFRKWKDPQIDNYDAM